MFAYIDKVDKKVTPNIVRRYYFLTQGDRFNLTATPVNESEKVISGVEFNIANPDGIIFYKQKYDYDEKNNIYILNVTGDITKDWAVTEQTSSGDPYIYEVKVRFVDKQPETLARAGFTIWEQNKEVIDGQTLHFIRSN